MWPGDVNDVMHRKRVRRIFGKSLELSFCLGRRRLTFACSPRPGGGCRTWFGTDGKVRIERWHLSPYVEKPLNSKVIKCFVPELRSCMCFSCFGIPMLSMCVMDIMNVLRTGMNMSISFIHVWLCITTPDLSGPGSNGNEQVHRIPQNWTKEARTFFLNCSSIKADIITYCL